jgi:hypothetical protein
MNLPVMALLIVLLLVVWLFIRRRQTADTEKNRPSTRGSSSNTAFHAVSIRFANSACEAARDMAGRRFLATAAPKLPLPECDVLECNCRFVHHKDRRTGQDRRSPFASSGLGGGTGSYEKEQRKGRDRRSSDDEDSF